MTQPETVREVTCSFCSGTGKDPFGIMSSLSSCSVCGGKGRVLIPMRSARCAHCRGTGAIKTLTCTVCRGKGSVLAADNPTAACPDCGGSGDDPSASAMACLKCRGRGWITVVARSEPGEGRGERTEQSQAKLSLRPSASHSSKGVDAHG